MALPTESTGATVVEHTAIVTSEVGPRVRWSGVMSGFFVAVGALLLMVALGLAIGITALGNLRAATGETAEGLGIGTGIWAFITLLVALFFGGMVSTQVTDRPDRPGAVIHGVLVWVLFLLFTLWLMVSGISLGLSGVFGAMNTLVRGATPVVGLGAGAADSDLAQRLGLDDPNQLLARLDDPRTASALATATGMSTEEARATLSDLRARRGSEG